MLKNAEFRQPPFYIKLLFAPLRLFFYLLYHQMAWTYDWVAAIVSLGLWQEWVLSILPYLDGKNILELGHGPGHLQKALHNKNGSPAHIFGLDASPQMSRIARRNLNRAGIIPDLVNGKAERLPFAARVFQTVASTFPSEYILHQSTLEEVYRILAPGGRLVVLTSAFITGRRYRDQAASWLFRVTRQSSPLDRRLLKTAHQAGFQVRAKEIKLKTSLIILFIAEKEPGGP
jgi:ubiquinone/menaquinone biosynthesis C-methylase UbiE